MYIIIYLSAENCLLNSLFFVKTVKIKRIVLINHHKKLLIAEYVTCLYNGNGFIFYNIKYEAMILQCGN